MKRLFRILRNPFNRRRKPRHPSRFKGYIAQAKACVRSKGHKYVDGRDTRWHLVPGRPTTQGGSREWVFSINGKAALGAAIWGKVIEIHLGSPDGHKYSSGTARHEAGHVGRMQVGDFGHHPDLRGCFAGWSDTGRRSSTADMDDLDAPEHFAVVDYADGSCDVVSMSHQDYIQLCLGGSWAEAVA